MEKKDKELVEYNLQHLKNTVLELNEGIQEQNWNKRDLTAMAAYLANMYNGYENVIRTLLKSRGIEISKGEQWHKDLLDRAKSEKLVPDEMLTTLKGMLGFRHMQIHGYAYMLKEKDVRESSIEAVKSHHVFEKHIQRIIEQ